MRSEACMLAISTLGHVQVLHDFPWVKVSNSNFMTISPSDCAACSSLTSLTSSQACLLSGLGTNPSKWPISDVFLFLGAVIVFIVVYIQWAASIRGEWCWFFCALEWPFIVQHACYQLGAIYFAMFMWHLCFRMYQRTNPPQTWPPSAHEWLLSRPVHTASLKNWQQSYCSLHMPSSLRTDFFMKGLVWVYTYKLISSADCFDGSITGWARDLKLEICSWDEINIECRSDFHEVRSTPPAAWMPYSSSNHSMERKFQHKLSLCPIPSSCKHKHNVCFQKSCLPIIQW